VAGPTLDVAARALSREATEALRGAVAGLSEEHRETLVLALIQGLSYPEVARVLGVPLGTVKSRMHAAIRQVREALRQRGIEP
jgi:RNA polymerase sigma-70 factor (ECF subfamily)